MRVVKMRLEDNLSFKEIAEETNVSINTALGRMRYALINLRKMVDDKRLVLTTSWSMVTCSKFTQNPEGRLSDPWGGHRQDSTVPYRLNSVRHGR